MSDLVEFLLARIGEDEREAERGRRHNDRGIYARDNYGCLLVDPARVLAECEAKRRIVDVWREADRYGGDAGAFADDILRALALPYADHPDFREEWRP